MPTLDTQIFMVMENNLSWVCEQTGRSLEELRDILADANSRGVIATVSVKPKRTPAEQHLYDRFMTEDEDREEGDPVRKPAFEPCCREHKEFEFCVLEDGHAPISETLGR